MPDKKIIAVVGATGAQGGGLVRAILADPNGGFAARALTRDVNSAKARELAKLGAEVGHRLCLGAQSRVGIFENGAQGHGVTRNARVFDSKMLLMF